MARSSPELLLDTLRAHPKIGGAELARLLGNLSRPTLMRWLARVNGKVVSRGQARRTKYAAKRGLRGSMAALPLYALDEQGRGSEIGALDLLYPQGTALAARGAFPWPLDEDGKDGWFDSLPYPLLDSRPQGFLGRNFAHRYALDLGVSENPEQWSETDIAHVLVSLGHDQPGNLILGEPAYRRFLESRAAAPERTISAEQIETKYPELADMALSHGVSGSSAGGEFPKFTARRNLDDGIAEVIVKFSGADESPAVQRWSDLLVCEHLALESISRILHIPAARSSILRHGGRTFLEVIRFDRHGMFGRSPVCTLTSVNAALVGVPPGPWQKAASQLCAAGWLSRDDLECIRRIWWFGRLIANTDMHEGNLAFRPGLSLAPVYDMLPMLYAPLRGGELPIRNYSPELPLPGESEAWLNAAHAAIGFWDACEADQRISSSFRELCAANRATLAKTVAAGF